LGALSSYQYLLLLLMPSFKFKRSLQ